MPQAIITIAGITPPGTSKKQGKVTDSYGKTWNVWGDKLQNYRMGVTYDITYEENEYNGTKFYLIKTADPVQAAPPPPQPGNPEPQQRAATQPSQPMNPNKDEMIFICGALNNAFANQNTIPFELTAMEIATFVKKMQQVWRATLGNRAVGDMNDEIPF